MVAQPTCLLVYCRAIYIRDGTRPPPLEDMRRRAPGMHSSQARRRGVDEASAARGQSGGRVTALHSPWMAGQKMPQQHGFFNQRQQVGPSLGVDLAVDFSEQAAVDFSEQGARRGSGKVA